MTKIQNNVGIYRYVNKVNGKSYVGQSTSLRHRHTEHISLLRRGEDGCTMLQRAWNKYGEENFDYEVLCFCEPCELDTMEQKYIEEFDSYLNGYNCNKGGSGNSGFNHSDETKKKIGAASKGHPVSEEQRQLISAAQKGKSLSEDHKKALSDAWTEERKILFSASRRGSKNPSYGRSGKDACNSLPIINNFGDFFFTAVDAEHWYGAKIRSGISSCIHGKLKSSGRHPITGLPMEWRRATEEEILSHL